MSAKDSLTDRQPHVVINSGRGESLTRCRCGWPENPTAEDVAARGNQSLGTAEMAA